MKFDLEKPQRDRAWRALVMQLEEFYAKTENKRMAIYPKRQEVLSLVESDFDRERSMEEAITSVTQGLEQFAVQTTNPNYYGMFNPRTSFPSIMADAISAVYNPQLAAWSHAPYAVEIEHRLIQEFGKKFGYTQPDIDGVFATGGQEAHITAVLSALNMRYPDFAKTGAAGLLKKPIIYASQSSHHAIIKAARVCGLGSDFVRLIEVDMHQKLKVEALGNQIQQDIEEGFEPFFVLVTMGSTGSGAIDPIQPIAELTRLNNVWLHADAAYGGGSILSSKNKHVLNGIHQADSITFDAHKWLSVPMAASMFITKHPFALARTFSIKADFMPETEDEIDRLSSYTNSIQWSRRFIGLKLYLPLLVFGWKGFDETITHQIEMGRKLRKKLIENNWTLYNDTVLPIVCFTDLKYERDSNFSKYIYESFLETGEAWIINYPIGDKYTLRACITNYATEEKHLNKLIALLNDKRAVYELEYA